MTLEQIAQQAMDYLDSVGVAANWNIIELSQTYALRIDTDYGFHICFKHEIPFLLKEIRKTYPKNPAVMIKEAYLSAGFDVDEHSFKAALEYLNQKSPA